MSSTNRHERCPICTAPAAPAFTATVLGHHRADFVQCHECLFLYAADPYWLDEAYDHAMADTDTGALLRNLYNVVRCTATLGCFFDLQRPCVDVGGGHGVFVRLMRDVGCDFRWRDAHAENIFARGFEHRGGHDMQLATAFEVFEHLVAPLEFAAEALAWTDAGALLLTTELFSGERPDPGWPYFAFESGQHIAFYHRCSLEALARRLNRVLISRGNWHLLAPRGVSPSLFRLVASPGAALLFPWFKLRVASLTQADHARIKGGQS